MIYLMKPSMKERSRSGISNDLLVDNNVLSIITYKGSTAVTSLVAHIYTN